MGHRQARLPLDETFPTVAIADVRPRVLLQTDGGFTCMRANSVREVRADRTGELFVRCGCGRHYLDGQAENGRYIGLALHPRQPRALAA